MGVRGKPLEEQGGSALIIVMLATSAVATLALALALTTSLETDIAANSHASVQALAVADAAAARALADLSGMMSWDSALSGASSGAIFDGAHGVRQVGGATIDLDQETALQLCGAASCTGKPPDAMTAARPWGSNNPRWTVFSSGTAAAILGTSVGMAPGYFVVWIGDDPAENDAEPFLDGGPPVTAAGTVHNPGAGVVLLRVVGWGIRQSRRELELAVERDLAVMGAPVRLRVWRERRGISP